MGLREEMPLGARRAGRFSAQSLFRSDAYDLLAPAELHPVEYPMLRAVRLDPFTAGIYFNWITGEDYWVREPDRYPGDRYYGFTSRMRTHLYVGQRFTYYLRNDSLLRHITLYYELSANDLDIIAKYGNKSLDLSEIVYFSVGIKFQLLR